MATYVEQLDSFIQALLIPRDNGYVGALLHHYGRERQPEALTAARDVDVLLLGLARLISNQCVTHQPLRIPLSTKAKNHRESRSTVKSERVI